jgi:SOS response regulatory protein OraA/RecX
MHHYITSEIGSRRSIKKIRQELIEAGWDKKIVDKKLPLN